MEKGDAGQFSERKKQCIYEQYNFHWQTSKFLGDHGFNILIQKYFPEEWEQIYQLSLKSKTMEGNSTGISFS